jgi:hypothetical protein
MWHLLKVLSLISAILFLVQTGHATEPGATGQSPSKGGTGVVGPKAKSPCPVSVVAVGTGTGLSVPKCPPITDRNSKLATHTAKRQALPNGPVCPPQCPTLGKVVWTTTGTSCDAGGEFVTVEGQYDYDCK